MSAVLILCPTFDHAEALIASTASVRAQRFENWQLVVIGDGAPAKTREIMAEITAVDRRISYQAHPKTVRFGEIYRDPIIRQSDAEFVLQLGDDDLWAPDHIHCMLELLERSEWGNQAPIRVAPDGGAQWWPINHGTASMRASIVQGVPVSAGPNFVAYRREAYLRLVEGWTCAPPPGPSDAYMWAKFFRLPTLDVASTAATTAVKFPSHVDGREELSSVQRLAELQPWLQRLSEPGFVRSLCAKASIYHRLRKLFGIHQAHLASSVDEALLMCGFSPAPLDALPSPARNGQPMTLPLSPAQLQEAERALEVCKLKHGQQQA